MTWLRTVTPAFYCDMLMRAIKGISTLIPSMFFIENMQAHIDVHYVGLGSCLTIVSHVQLILLDISTVYVAQF